VTIGAGADFKYRDEKELTETFIYAGIPLELLAYNKLGQAAMRVDANKNIITVTG
jgi:hypothetical protein